MKLLVIGNEDRYRMYMPKDLPVTQTMDIVFCKWGTPEEEMLRLAGDADVIAVDAMAAVPASLIERMPNLKLIHSEGVGYQGVDVAAASKAGVRVCNCKGVNAGAVAEQTVLLMLALLRSLVVGHNTELAGGQIQMKERLMTEGIRELSEMKVGLIGFGDIAKAVAERLLPFGCQLYYYSLHRKSPELEAKYSLHYLSLKELAEVCDIISIHAASNEQTRGMIDREFLSHMKKDGLLINTARGDLVDNEALREALIAGQIGGAGLDTIAPEPTTADNPLVNLPSDCLAQVIYSPHIGGITTATFRRAHRCMWQAFQDIADGKVPKNIVN
jgi:lactate dehydrogenase-like 2-hydroxyacid dehydrogenase